MRNTSTVYLSDLLSVPMPQKAASHEDYLRKIKNRRILWALMPYLLEGAGAILMVSLTVAGVIVFAVGMGC